MTDPARRRMLAVTSAALGTLLAGCATGEDGTTTGETETTGASTTTAETTATESTTTTPEQTSTAESTTSTESTTTGEPTTTASGTTTGESTTTGDAQATVTVGPGGDLVFEPSSVTVSTGETVAWEWDSGGHNVVVDSQPDGGEWTGTDGGASTTYGQGHTYTFTFDVAGTYEYVCAPHQSAGMRGTVIVE